MAKDLVKQVVVEHSVSGEKLVVPKRYTPEKVIGKGSYGVVCVAKDDVTNVKCAIKKNKDVFQSDCVSKRVLRELKILSHMKHPNIVGLLEVVVPTSYNNFKDLYLVNELMETDLRNIIRSKQKLTNQHCQFIVYQLVCALSYTHSASILHRDLKPENILINSDSTVKLADFGLARFIDFENDPTMSTNYVQTRWYRAPELLLNNNKVSRQADIWSVGCILAEILTGEVLFKGSSPIDQIKRIIRLLGTPNTENIIGSPEGVDFVNRLGKCKGRGFNEIFAGQTPDAIDLLSKMLHFNPESRISAAEALQHPYFKDFYDEKLATAKAEPYDFAYEETLEDNDDSIKIEMLNTIFKVQGLNLKVDSDRKFIEAGAKIKKKNSFLNLFRRSSKNSLVL